MKKITLLMGLFMGTMAFSQVTIVDRPKNGSGYYSEYWDADEIGLYSADYFELENSVSVSELVFPGFTQLGGGQIPGDGIYLDFSLYIYESDGTGPNGDPTDPSTAFIALSNIDLSNVTITDGGSSSTIFTVDVTAANGGTPVVLPAGKYYISPVPTVEDADPQWFWFGSDLIVDKDAVVNDPYDLFGEGLEGWTSITSLQAPPATFPSFGWTMKGDVLGVNDNIADLVSVFPNPATDVLNVKLNSSIEVSDVAMYNVLGKKVGVSYNNGVINVSGLAQGVYVLKVNTTAGTLTQKVVKQ